VSSVICKQCGRENRSHFKFCLGCGVELNKDNVIVKPEATIPPVMPPPPEPSHKLASAPTMAATPGSELADYLKSQGISIPESSRPAAPTPPPAPAPFAAPMSPSAPPPAPAPFAAPPPAASPFAAPPPAASPFAAPPPAPAPFAAPPSAPAPFAAPPPAASPFAAPMSPSAPPPAASPFAAPPSAPAPFAAPPPAPAPFAPPPAPAPFAPPPAASPFAAPMSPSAPPPAPAPVDDRSDELPFMPPAGPAGPAPIAQSGGFEMADTVCADDDQQAMIAPKPAPAGGQKICSQCGSAITPGFKFCGNCGSPAIMDAPAAPQLDSTLPAPAPFAPPPAPAPAPAPVPVARLIVQRPDGSTAPVIDLFEGETVLGRSTHDPFSNDYYMSPKHCKLTIDSGSIFVEDMGSLNGTFFRLSREELLKDGDMFRVGTEVLRYRALPPVEELEDGTIAAGSPNLEAWGRLELIMGKDAAGQAFSLTGERIRIGREEGDITFPDDGYVSGEHLEITRIDNATYLVDLNSSNGTYLNIKSLMELDPATPILMGYQLYRIELL